MKLELLEPIGFRLDGSPIWPLFGASPEGDGEEGDGEEGGENSEGEGTGSALHRALERERAAVKAAKAQARPWLAFAKENGYKDPEALASDLAALRDGREKASSEAEQVRTELLEKTNKRIVRSTIRALASRTFADPSDAVLNLDPAGYEVDDDGDVDEEAIQKDLENLLKKKPHLGVTEKRTNYEGGARRTAEPPKDMNDQIRRLARR